MTTQALLNFNGTSGTQIFTDDTGNQSWGVHNGNPVLSNVETVWGSTSLLFPDLDNGSIRGILANSLTGDFTFEVWLRLWHIVWGQQIVYFQDIGVTVMIEGTTQISVYYSTANIIQTFTWRNQDQIVFDEWFHFALVRKNGRLYCLLNGRLANEIGEDWLEPISVIELGEFPIVTTSRYFDGYMDSLRISDEAVYETNNVDYLQTEPGLIYNISTLGHQTGIETLGFMTDQQYTKTFNGLGGNTDLIDQIEFVCGNTDDVVIPDPIPTSTNIISGNVVKLGLPYELKLVAVSVELNPEILGQTTSDPVTGDYSIDVYPWTGNTLIYAAPDYGADFSPGAFLATGQVIHPTVPNKNVYIAQNDGLLSGTEPVWPESGFITSNEVQLLTAPLYRPLMNGFIKPTVTPI